MLGALYRHLYHRRQQRAARRRLAGKYRPAPGWHRFSYNVFQRASKERDHSKHRIRLLLWLGGVPAGVFLVWFLWQSIGAIGMFQP